MGWNKQILWFRNCKLRDQRFTINSCRFKLRKWLIFLFTVVRFFFPQKFKMHFKLDVTKILDANNAFFRQRVSSLQLSRSQLPRNRREITAENLRKGGIRYKTLELSIHIVDRAVTKIKSKQTNPHKRKSSHESFHVLLRESYECNCNLYLVLTVKVL